MTNPQTPREAISKALIEQMKKSGTRQTRTVKGEKYSYGLFDDETVLIYNSSDQLIETVKIN
jgi:hypothetical protein